MGLDVLILWKSAFSIISDMDKCRFISIATIAVAACFSLSVEAAAPKKTFAIQGEVVSAANGSPVDFASVLVTPSQLYTMTDEKGGQGENPVYYA